MVRGNTASNAAGIPVSPSSPQIKMSFTPRVFQIVEHLHPELGTLGGLDPQTENLNMRAVTPHPRPDKPPCCAPRRLRGSSRAARRRRPPGRPGSSGWLLPRPSLPLSTPSVTVLIRCMADFGAIGFDQIEALDLAQPSGHAHTKAMMLSSKAMKRRACLGSSTGSRSCPRGHAASRSAACRHRSAPSSISTPLRWLLAASASPHQADNFQMVQLSSAFKDASISAFLNANPRRVDRCLGHRTRSGTAPPGLLRDRRQLGYGAVHLIGFARHNTPPWRWLCPAHRITDRLARTD